MDKGIIVHAVLFNGNREVLLIRRSLSEDTLPGLWDIPGGTLDDGEDPEEGAIRETKEETGIDIQNLSLFHYTSNIDRKKNKQFIRLIFIGVCNETNILLNKEDHDQHQWVSIDKIPINIKTVEYLPSLFAILKKNSHHLVGYSQK
ncbi:MAG: NUDIX hydrolase [Candidatus Moranbacteria bacterium]|nr:NUDIX hydrolase [Candidatus Moranbacteria bacterium]MDD3964842.1 NUDIX hydrolase [Candidatus Moranbacteria bacterium]